MATDEERAYYLSILGNTEANRLLSNADLARMFYTTGGAPPGTADGQVLVWSVAQNLYVPSDLGRDTGPREIKTLALNGWAVGSALLQRVGNKVEIGISATDPTAQTSLQLFVLPLGFRPVGSRSYSFILRPVSGSTAVFGNVTGGGQVFVSTTASNVQFGNLLYETADPWPSSLPGVPA